MRLVIDGRRLTAERTGVGRYLEVLLQDWATTGPPLPETLVVLRDRAGLTRVPVGLGDPGRGRSARGGRAWSGSGSAWAGGSATGDVLFAPANLVPWGWRGKTVLVDARHAPGGDARLVPLARPLAVRPPLSPGGADGPTGS